MIPGARGEAGIAARSTIGLPACFGESSGPQPVRKAAISTPCHAAYAAAATAPGPPLASGSGEPR